MVLLRDNLTEDFTGEQLFQNGDGRVRIFHYAVGKIGGAAIGSHLSHAPVTVRGTIAAAAVINEVIAVFLARKGFQLAGELNAAQSSSTPSAQSA